MKNGKRQRRWHAMCSPHCDKCLVRTVREDMLSRYRCFKCGQIYRWVNSKFTMVKS